MNTGKLFQKFLGALIIMLAVIIAIGIGDATGTIVMFPMGLWLLLTKKQLIGDDPMES